MKAALTICAVLACSIGVANAQAVATAQTRQTQTSVTQPGGIAFGKRCHGPIDVASDSFEGDMQTKTGIYTGNVVVTQSTCRLRANKVTAEATTGNDINRLTATGNVVFNSDTETAIGDNAVYDLGPKLLTLTGKVVLTKGKNVMRGTLLVVNQNTGIAHLTAKGMPGGRVQTSFTPKQTDSDEGGSSKPRPRSDTSN